jgi:ketosteroid isomerase-like protein
MNRIFVVAAFVLLASACASAQREPGLKGLRDASAKYFNDKQPDKLVDLYASDATVLSADGQRLFGNLNIRAYLKNIMDSGKVTVSLQSVTTDCLTEIGYETGAYSETIANGGSTLTGNAKIDGNSTIVGGAPKKLQGNYLVVIRKYLASG